MVSKDDGIYAFEENVSVIVAITVDGKFAEGSS